MTHDLESDSVSQDELRVLDQDFPGFRVDHVTSLFEVWGIVADCIRMQVMLGFVIPFAFPIVSDWVLDSLRGAHAVSRQRMTRAACGNQRNQWRQYNDLEFGAHGYLAAAIERMYGRVTWRNHGPVGINGSWNFSRSCMASASLDEIRIKLMAAPCPKPKLSPSRCRPIRSVARYASNRVAHMIRCQTAIQDTIQTDRRLEILQTDQGP